MPFPGVIAMVLPQILIFLFVEALAIDYYFLTQLRM